MTSDALEPSSTAPCLLEVWAPWCSACRAMERDLDAVALRFAGSVVVQRVDASREPERVRSLGVTAAPTLIGYVDGREVLRTSGRLSRPALHAAFASLADGRPPAQRSVVGDVGLRLGSGGILVVSGLAIGGAWPLTVIGATVLVTACIPIVRRHRAHRP